MCALVLTDFCISLLFFVTVFEPHPSLHIAVLDNCGRQRANLPHKSKTPPQKKVITVTITLKIIETQPRSIGFNQTPIHNSKVTGVVAKTDKDSLRQSQKISTLLRRVVFFGLPLQLLSPSLCTNRHYVLVFIPL